MQSEAEGGSGGGGGGGGSLLGEEGEGKVTLGAEAKEKQGKFVLGGRGESFGG